MRSLALVFVVLSSVATAAPVARWDFDAEESTPLVPHGGVHRDQPGPRPPTYPDFSPQNTAVKFDGNGAYFSFADTETKGKFDFHNGDAVTLEAWVLVDELKPSENVYVIGKGRTGSPEFPRDNQNWALRLREVKGQAGVSFLFATPRVAGVAKTDSHWHRWTTTEGFAPGSGWHHIAATYRFGEPESVQTWIDGKRRPGSWDMGGPTKEAPVVDNDAIWIGSSQGGHASNSFRGSLDAIAIHREILDEDVLKARFRREGEVPTVKPVPELMPDLGILPAQQVVVTFSEGLAVHDRWPNEGEALATETTRWAGAEFLLPRLPQRFDAWGIRESWKGPVLIRVAADVRFPAGTQRLLVRTRGLSRLWVNGELVVRTKPLGDSPSGEEPITPVAEPPLPGLRRAEHRQQEAFGEIKIPAEGIYRVVLEALAGGKKFRVEPGETCVAMQTTDGRSFVVLQPVDAAVPSLPLTDLAITAVLARVERSLADFDDRNRRAAAASQASFWQGRHEQARTWLQQTRAPEVPAKAAHPIDAFLAAKIAQAAIQKTEVKNGDSPAASPLLPRDLVPAPLVGDAAFMRRAFLDTVGVIPTESDARRFLDDQSPDKRRQLIERLLADERWADHWMSYWQDVLAENPTLINASLNTTGPFRWFLYDALRDDKPFDRLVTELILLRGSAHEGGSAGFGIAADNDAPLAAKGQIIAGAFLGIELQCARCHDSPYHSTLQRDLYALAAMFERKPITVPKTSSVPAAFFEKNARDSLIKVTLKIGDPVAPNWPFAEVTGAADDGSLSPLVQHAEDTRERLAALLTSPRNVRFARVVVNRTWRRLIGAGIVEPVHDWEGRSASHPELLDWLAREFVAHDYSVKHVARLILTSQLYQRAATGRNLEVGPESRYFVAPELRRMSAEQIVDSLYLAAGQAMHVEELTFDPDGRRPADNRLSLGVPRRAWMFASLANERDRPSLSLPRAQVVADVLEAFGWSGSRQSPRTERETAPNVLQPGVLANGVATMGLTRAALDSGLADLAVSATSPEALVDSLFLRYFSRLPTVEQRQPLVAVLAEGFETRLAPADQVRMPDPPPLLPRVTWSNHLQAEATSIALELERQARRGPPPDPRLVTVWREAYEDVVWTLVNSREFVWAP